MNVIVDNLLINYVDEGKGKTILMLHGWGNNLKIFEELATNLAKNNQVIRLDLPGFGDSQIPDETWEIIDYAKFIKDFCVKLNIHPEILIGHSFGGRIIIKLVAEGIIKSKKIILLASAGIKESDSLRNKLFKVAAKGGKIVTSLPGIRKFQKNLKEKFYKQANSTDYLYSGEMKQIFLNTINEDLRNDASKIKVPTLLIWGKQDNEIPLKQAYILNRQIKNSQLEVLNHAGHFVFQDKPTETIKLIRKSI
ncbi:MAG: alpha/beta hydrolase [bacterium]|nr:alpha/beta hydrolase [bacterium]